MNPKRKTTASAGSARVRSLTVEITIVGVDSNYDVPTQAAYGYREANVYPRLRSSGLNLVRLTGNMATRIYLKAELEKQGVEFLTGSGHGDYDTFTGSFHEALLRVGEYRAAEVRGKIIHLLSCRTAFDLGIDAVNNDCLAFFGYDANFVWIPGFEQYFFECDAEIDFAIVEGQTASQAFQRAISRFNRYITYFDRRGNDGDEDVVATLQFNRDHLCAPDRDSRWGSPDAQI